MSDTNNWTWFVKVKNMVVTKYITLNSTLSSIYRLFMADWFREDVREKCINCANSTLRERRVGLRCALGHGIWAQKVGKKKRKRRGGGIGWRSIFSLLDLMIDFEWTSLEWCSIQVVPVISHFFCYFKLPVAPPDFCPFLLEVPLSKILLPLIHGYSLLLCLKSKHIDLTTAFFFPTRCLCIFCDKSCCHQSFQKDSPNLREQVLFHESSILPTKFLTIFPLNSRKEFSIYHTYSSSKTSFFSENLPAITSPIDFL